MGHDDLELGQMLGRLAQASEDQNKILKEQAETISGLASTMQIWQLQGLPKCAVEAERIKAIEDAVTNNKKQVVKVWGVELVNFDTRSVMTLIICVALLYAILVAHGVIPRLTRADINNATQVSK